MTRILAAIFLLVCAALLAGLAVVLARPRWRWEDGSRWEPDDDGLFV